ncbi:hypothetical protein B0T09DRAFT_402152 [Sordaria sp. MPI-SDFR-AT-0083]|nr:hypothetical protein B0T09DRAFT_402152 [Sordaria sp. MPI-SDFR-AT-0083]
MHYALLLSFLTSGLLGLPFGAAAPLPSSPSLSLKELNSKPLHLERELPSRTSSLTPSQTLHSPLSKRSVLFNLAVVSAIATAPMNPSGAKKREDHLPVEASPNTAKTSEATPRLTERQQEGSAVEERSPNTPDEEPAAWSGLDRRSSDIENAENHDSTAVVRANTPGIPDSAKDPDYNRDNGYWSHMTAETNALIGVSAGFLACLLCVAAFIQCRGGKHRWENLICGYESRAQDWKERNDKIKAELAVRRAAPPQ